MKTKNIFKALAVAMLMPAMLLTTACSNEDDFVNNNENNIKQGYTLPVTINVTREGDATTRATYNESTGKLSFSSGDQLFVSGIEATAGKFAGTLTWQSGGTFSGTLTTEKEFTGTAQELLTQAYQAYLVDNDNYKNFVSAILLPAGYNNYEFITLKTNNGYDATISTDLRKTFALTKAAAVEQFSLESTFSYSNGFSLYPSYGILNFTITGLTPNTDVNVNFSDYTPAEYGNTMVGTVHTDGSGNATFAVAVYAYSSKNIQTCSLYVNGNPIALVNSSKPIDAGHIYNITRSAAPAATSLSELKTAINGGTDCSSYIGWEVNSEGAIAESGVSGTKIGYVAYVSTSDVDADVSGSRILVIASADASATALTWGSDGTYRHLEAVEDATDLKGYSNTNTLQGYGAEAHPAAYAAWNYGATIPSGGASPAHWFMPTMKQWKNMRDAKGGTYSAMATAYGIDGQYWTSNEYFNGEDYSECNNYAWHFNPNSSFMSLRKLFDIKVRSIFAY